MATSNNTPATAKKSDTKSTSIEKDLETQFPLSEKDEVKKAERKTNKNVKK